MKLARPCVAASIALLLASGCKSPVEAPPASAHARHGLVRAADAEAALRRVELLDGTCETLLAALPGLRPTALELWMLDAAEAARGNEFWARNDAASFEQDGVVVIALAARAERDEPMLVAHELAHVLPGPAWRSLQAPYREGLAEAVGLRFGGKDAARSRCSRLVAAAHAEGGLRLELTFAAAEAQRLPLRPTYEPPPGPGLNIWDNWEPSEQNIARAAVLVDLAVERVGWEDLHALCVVNADRDPARWLDDASLAWWLDDASLQCLAGVRAGGPEWLAALESRLGEDELRYAAEVEARPVAELLVAACRPVFGAVTADEFVARAAPSLGVPGGPSVRLVDVPEARTALVAAWEEREP